MPDARLPRAMIKPGAPPVAVMSYRLWQQRYGSDPSVIGSVFDIDEKPFTVVGIAPPGFFGDRLRNNPPDFFLPLNTEPFVEADADLYKPDTHWLDLIGRIRPGANPGIHRGEMRVELKQWLRSHWGEMSADDRAKFPEQTLFLSPGGAGITSMREEYEHWLQILMMVSGFVLLIVCANVANLMLVRGMERRRQTSLSMALGARASRLVRQALTESILLSLFGGAAGLAIAFAGTRLILHFAFPSAAGMAGIPISASPSMPVLLFAFAVSLITGIAFGIAPAWMATRSRSDRGASRSEPLHGTHGLAAAKDAGGVPGRALAGLAIGVRTAHGGAAQSGESEFRIRSGRRTVVSIDPQACRLSARPTHAALPAHPRFAIEHSWRVGSGSLYVLAAKRQRLGQWRLGRWTSASRAPTTTILLLLDRVTAGYFEVIGNPIIRGRGISEQDTAASRHVAVINEAFARKFFKNEDPIGKHFGRDGIGSEPANTKLSASPKTPAI